MSTSVLLQPAPGWYPDPAGQSAYRWWDGDDWTEGTHAGEQTGTGHVPVQLFADPIPEAPAAPPVLLPTLQLTDPAAATTTPAPRLPAASPVKTRWSTLLVAFPFLYPFAVGMVVGLAYAGGAASNPLALVIIGAVVAVAALIPAWVFADYDRRELVARGYEPAPALAWMLLLPPVAYLLARRRVVGPRY